MDVESKIPYQRQLMRGQARTAILAAAAKLFSERGYARTSISDIAAGARVARPTVSTAVGNKPDVLRAVVEAYIGEIDPAEQATQRPWFKEVLAEPDPIQMLRLHARNIRSIGQRISELYYATEVAAASDPVVATIWEELEEARLEAARVVALELLTRPGLQPDLRESEVTDLLFATISPSTYRALVRQRGRTPDDFERWAGDLMVRMLVADAGR